MDWRGLRFFTFQTAPTTTVAVAQIPEQATCGNLRTLHLNPHEINIFS
jgi:hypothetical protein